MSDAFSIGQQADTARLAPLVSPTALQPKKPQPDPNQDSDEAGFLSVGRLREQFIDYLDTKVDEIEEQKTSRHYYHGAQYTADQIRILRERHQPPLTWNRVARKINGIVGLVERMRSDPKALPRSIKDEQGANVATEVVRYVCDNSDFKGLEYQCLLQACIDGIAGVQIVLTKGDQGDPDVKLTFVIGDEYFYSPTAYRQTFEDNSYEGLSKWLNLDDAIEMFPDKAEELKGLVQGDSDLTTSSDREYKWVITSTKRVRLIEHWYKHQGEWRWAFYVSNVILDQGLSPFYDATGKRCSPFHMFAVAVDHDGDRYGFVRNLKSPQDSLNQSKSKALHIANSRRLIMEKGAVDDVQKARVEWSRPDGVVEVTPGLTIKADDRTQDFQAFTEFSNDAKSEIDQFANLNVAEIRGAIGNISGRAIQMLRQPGMAELGPFILAIRQWKLSLYRAIWNTAQRYWTAQRWIRVTNNDGLAKFLQLNGLTIDQFGRPSLVNAVGQINVDIIIEEGPDVESVLSDTYDMLRSLPPGSVPPQVLIEMNPNIPRSEKNRIIKMMNSPVAQMGQKLALQGAAARNAKTIAEAKKAAASVDQIAATAAHKRSQVGTEAARAGHLATRAHLDAAQFAKDTLLEAANLGGSQNAQTATAPPQQPVTPQPMPQPARVGVAPLPSPSPSHLDLFERFGAQP